MFYMQERMGAWQIGDDPDSGAVEFRLFFPSGFNTQIQSIRVAGNFQAKISNHENWDFSNGFPLARIVHAKGEFWEFQTVQNLDAGFYEYKYLVTFTDGSSRIVSDPCSRYGGSNSQNAAFVVGGSSPADNLVRPLANGRKHLREQVIYEMHIDDFTDEFRRSRAPLDAVQDKLDYLVELGINAILFMPWTAWKHREFDWGYEPFQYFAVEYRYANQEQDPKEPQEKISRLKQLISACHDRDIHVIMDGVFNHASTDFPYKFFYLNTEDCPFTGTFGGTFPGLQDLDFHNTCTQEFVRDVCLYWFETFAIDGIRFDNTVNYLKQSDSRGIPSLLQDLQDYMDAHNEPNFSMTLEHLGMDAVQLTNSTRATSYWDNAMYQQCFDSLRDNRIDSRILNSFNNDRYLDSSGKAATIYIGNHDHSQIAWRAGSLDNKGAMQWYKTQPHVIALLTSPGIPMILNGQEFGEDHWIPEDDKGTGRRVVPRPLRWKFTHDDIGHNLLTLYKRLIELRRNFPALRSRNFYPDYWEEWQTRFNTAGFGVDTERQLVIFHRWGQDEAGNLQRFYIVLNFSDQSQPVTVFFPENGSWLDVLSHDNWTPHIENQRLDFSVNSNWGHVFMRSN